MRSMLWIQFTQSHQVLIKLIKPYTRIQIKFISGELNIESGDVESLLVSCILDNTISGRIDQVQLSQKFWESVLKIPCVDHTLFETEFIASQLMCCHRCLECWNLTRVARVLRDMWLLTSGTTSWTTCRSWWSTRWPERELLCQDVI